MPCGQLCYNYRWHCRPGRLRRLNLQNKPSPTREYGSLGARENYIRRRTAARIRKPTAKCYNYKGEQCNQYIAYGPRFGLRKRPTVCCCPDGDPKCQHTKSSWFRSNGGSGSDVTFWKRISAGPANLMPSCLGTPQCSPSQEDQCMDCMGWYRPCPWNGRYWEGKGWNRDWARTGKPPDEAVGGSALEGKNTWADGADMLIARTAFAAVLLGGPPIAGQKHGHPIIYVLGGKIQGGGIVDSVDKFSVGKWMRAKGKGQMDPMPRERAGFGAARLGNYCGTVLVTGGVSPGFPAVSLQNVDIFRPGCDKGVWKKAEDMTVPRWGHCVVGVARGELPNPWPYTDLVYSIGGLNNNGYLASVEVYNSGGKRSWKSVKPMQTKRFRAAATNLQAFEQLGGLPFIFVAGGVNESYTVGLDSVEVYDAEADTWYPGANLTSPRVGAVAVSFAGKVYVIGGAVLAGGGGGEGRVLASMDVWDGPVWSSKKVWTAGAKMATARWNAAAVALVTPTPPHNGKIYVMGGSSQISGLESGEPLKSMEIYDPQANKWAAVVEPRPTSNIGCSSYMKKAAVRVKIPPDPNAVTVDNIKKFYSDHNIKRIQDLISCCGSKLQPQTPINIYYLDDFWNALSGSSSVIYLGETIRQAVVIVAGMFAQFMHESANFSTCDEYNLGNTCSYGPCSCGQYGSNYMGVNYISSPKCPRNNNMNIRATTSCAAGPGCLGPMECTPNTASAGCCFWGRGPIQLTGQHNYKSFQNWLNDNKITILGISLCDNPNQICTNKQLLWLSAMYFWWSRVQSAIEECTTCCICDNCPPPGHEGGCCRGLVGNSTCVTQGYFPDGSNCPTAQQQQWCTEETPKPVSIFKKSLKDYIQNMGMDANYSNSKWLGSQIPATWPSGIGGEINRNKWSNKADANQVRICNFLRIMLRLGFIGDYDVACQL